MHHIGYRVADCGEALDAVKAQGFRVLDEQPRPGIPRHHRGVHPPQGCVRHAHRAGPGVAGGEPAGGSARQQLAVRHAATAAADPSMTARLLPASIAERAAA